MTSTVGWTHYWQRPIELSAKEFAAAATDLRRLLSTIEIPLAGFDGTGSARVEDAHIVFNGKAPAHCEPFEIARVEFDRRGRQEVRSFCKTEHLPYDLCVQASLIVLKHHIGRDLSVTSDGNDVEWDAARQLVSDTLGYDVDFTLAVKDDGETS